MRAGTLFHKCSFFRRALVDGEPVGDYELVFSLKANVPRGNGAAAVEAGQPVDRRDVRILVRDGENARSIEVSWRARLQGRDYIVSSVSPPQIRDRSVEVFLAAHVGEVIGG